MNKLNRINEEDDDIVVTEAIIQRTVTVKEIVNRLSALNYKCMALKEIADSNPTDENLLDYHIAHVELLLYLDRQYSPII